MSHRQDSKMEFSASVREAFRFVKKHIVRSDGTGWKKPFWAGFDEDDLFTSIDAGSINKAGYTENGDEKVVRSVFFSLKGTVVANVGLEGIRTPWNSRTSWTVTYVAYRGYFGPLEDRDPDWQTGHIPAGVYHGDVYDMAD